MTTITHACDRCGQTITTDRTALAVQSGPLLESGLTELDLCATCAGRLRDFLAALTVPDLMESTR